MQYQNFFNLICNNNHKHKLKIIIISIYLEGQMTLDEVSRIIEAESLYLNDLNNIEITSVFCCDLLSDVLAFTGENVLLLTGSTNAQVIYTANMINAVGIIFVRGKRPSSDVIEIAKGLGLPVLTTSLLMYETCGILYSIGIPGSN